MVLIVFLIVWFKPFSALDTGKTSTARSFRDALGLNATVPNRMAAHFEGLNEEIV